MEQAQTPSPESRRSSSRSGSDTSQVFSRINLTMLREAFTYLDPSLPNGWEDYFSVTRAGRSFGLHNECPFASCGEKPPEGMRGNRRWRWMAVHLAIHLKEKNGD